MSNKNITLKPELTDEFNALSKNNPEVTIVNLCTTDGFAVTSLAAKDLDAENDKISAVSSTIASLSNSCSKMLMQDEFNVTIVESNSGNTLFVRTHYLGLECVLTVTAKLTMSLATARYHTKKLAQAISDIKA